MRGRDRRKNGNWEEMEFRLDVRIALEISSRESKLVKLWNFNTKNKFAELAAILDNAFVPISRERCVVG